MELSFQLFDCDYVLVDNKPVVRLFGKTKDNNSVCAFYDGFLPYFYVLPRKNSEDAVMEFLEKNFKQLLVDVVREQKFLPTGFQKEKTQLLKIILKDPSQVARVREEMKKQDFVSEIFEADILFKYRFMADFDLCGMKWVRVTGDNANTVTTKTDIAMNAKSIEPLEENFNVAFKYLGVDIEVVPGREGIPNSLKNPIAMISLSFFPAFEARNTLVLVSKPVKRKEKDVLVFRNEREMLEEFVRIINNFDADIIVGYNINNFDFPYILDRLRVNKVSRAIGRCQQKQAISKKLGTRSRNSIVGRIVVDVYELIKESVEKGLLRLKRYGLGDVAKELLGEEKIAISHGEISKYWNGTEEQIEKLIEYARKDAELALKLLLEREMLDKFVELSKVSGLLLQDVLDSREAARVENLLLKEFDKQGFVIPEKPDSKEILKRMEEREAKGLKGALVLEPQIGLHKNCVVYLDFRSMYPSIFIAYNICPTTLVSKKEDIKAITTSFGTAFVSPKVREGIIPKIVKRLMEERDKVRDEMKAASGKEKKFLDAKQYALKIMTNAFYGYTGYPRARFYVLDIANAITSCGRELIQKTKHIVERDRMFKVIYGDTDSIMVRLQTNDLDEAIKLGEELASRINRELQGTVQIKIENVFKTLLVLSKKRYAGWSFERTNGEWNGEIIMKGIETVRRDWAELVSKTLYDVLEIILKEQDPKKALKYVKDVLFKLNKGETPLEDLVITKSISKPLKEYKGIQPHVELVKKLKKRSPAGAPSIGDRIGYVIVKGMQLMSNRAEDPEYVKQHNLKIDSRYYIESQILPPLERVFEALGISKADLIGVGKQLLLAEAIKEGLEKTREEPLESIDGIICSKCDKIFRRVSLVGKCVDCGGELLFHSSGIKSRYMLHAS
ncbi:MAG: DNA polymerase domain-containing protein [Candidatus Aenigmarchaeota archaeon]|nr:DNA polymerase domain-containing protein [Candidatus Aenigmarchaeota archaeon]